MSSTMTVYYDEGSTSKTLRDGTVVKRGVPVTVSESVGKKLIAQGFKKTTKKPPSSKSSTSKSSDKDDSGSSAVGSSSTTTAPKEE